jgi:flagellar motor switch protein FliN/FliY
MSENEHMADDNESGQINSDVLQNITVTLSIEVGRAMIKIRDLMRLSQGSVVELDRIAGDPLDLLVNNTVVAQGEIVLVNERYGIRLTRVAPASERMKNL